ncbi:MAG: hypothetical protein KAW14_02525 [Candidatus Aegiribacteria sp.]|nr:hypothetical protein [Candidatus Aegiribacteria sp.]
MKILVATFHTLPGYSGGWATPLDLLEKDFDVRYVVARGEEGIYELEDISVYGLRKVFRSKPVSGFSGRLWNKLSETAFGLAIRKEFRSFKPDFVLCLDMLSARRCISLRLPYALRIHTQPITTPPKEINRLLKGALFATLCPSVSIPGVEVLPHTEDLERFTYIEHPSAEEVVLVSSLDSIRRPMLFVEGVMKSSLKGTIVGDGPLRKEIESACASSGGKISYHEPVLRTELPAFLNRFQIGVACYGKVQEIYQMKVPEYQASGIFPLVMPWTHLALEAPELAGIFETPEELAALIDDTAKHWDDTLETRRKGRNFALKHYHVAQTKQRFREILEESGLI